MISHRVLLITEVYEDGQSNTRGWWIDEDEMRSILAGRGEPIAEMLVPLQKLSDAIDSVGIEDLVLVVAS